MQFDELHNRLFALAKKGTQDEHFAVSPTSGLKARRKGLQGKFNSRTKKAPLRDNANQLTSEGIKGLKNLQFTLFD